MAAFYHAASTARVRVYDTNGASIGSLYEQAGTDGAQLVIGPLDKQSVVDINLLPYRRVPVLALNYLPQGVAAGRWIVPVRTRDRRRSARDRAPRLRRRFSSGRHRSIRSRLVGSRGRIVPLSVCPARWNGSHCRHHSRCARRHRSGRQCAARRRQHGTHGSAVEDAWVRNRSSPRGAAQTSTRSLR